MSELIHLLFYGCPLQWKCKEGPQLKLLTQKQKWFIVFSQLMLMKLSTKPIEASGRSVGPRSSLVSGSRGRTLAVLSTLVALGLTGCNGESNPGTGGSNPGGNGGNGGEVVGGSGGEGGENPCANLPYQGLASKVFNKGETGSLTVEGMQGNDSVYEGVRITVPSDEVFDHDVLLGIQAVGVSNTPAGFDQLNNVEALRIHALNAKQPYIQGKVGCTENHEQVNMAAMGDASKQPFVEFPGVATTVFGLRNSVADTVNYQMNEDGTVFPVQFSSAEENVDYFAVNSPPAGVPILTRNPDNTLKWDFANMSDEGYSDDFIKSGLVPQIPNTTLLPAGQPGIWNSLNPYMNPTASATTFGLNQPTGLVNDESNDMVNLPEFPVISNLAIDCSSTGGFCGSGGLQYPVTFNVTDANNCTVTPSIINGSGPPGTNGPVVINVTDASSMHTTGPWAGDTIQLKTDCNGPGGSAIPVTIQFPQY